MIGSPLPAVYANKHIHHCDQMRYCFYTAGGSNQGLKKKEKYIPHLKKAECVAHMHICVFGSSIGSLFTYFTLEPWRGSHLFLND